MVVARLHSRLFEAAARDLDRQIRSQFVEESLRPEYLRDFQRHLHDMVRHIEAGADFGGRRGWAKRLVGRLIRPFRQHQALLNRMTIDRLSELHGDLTRLIVASERLHASLREDLAHQAEGLRAELAEAARRPRPAGEAARPDGPAGPPERAVPEGSRVILGTVGVRRPGYVHIDPTGGGPADASVPLDRLPVTPGTAAEVVVANCLETYPAAEVRARLLPYWASLLRPGGRLTIIADDFGAAVDRFRDDALDPSELAGMLFGEGGPARRSAYTPELLRQYVAEAGLTGASVTDRRQRPEANAYGFELVAFRPAA